MDIVELFSLLGEILGEFKEFIVVGFLVLFYLVVKITTPPSPPNGKNNQNKDGGE